jgi:hypothetical protein
VGRPFCLRSFTPHWEQIGRSSTQKTDGEEDPCRPLAGRLAAITAAERFTSDPLRCLALGRETWHGMNLRPFEKGAMRKRPE